MPDAEQPAVHEPLMPEPVERLDAPSEESAPLGPQTSGFTFREIFIGRDGLRAGWSLVLYIALLAALLIGTGNLVRVIRHHAISSKPSAAAQASNSNVPVPSEPMPISTVLIAEGISIFAVVVATWVMGKIERRRYSTFGLGGIRRTGNFLSGLAWGVAMLSLLVFALRATGLLVFDAQELFGARALGYGSVWLAGFLLVGLFEEYGFRGYLQYTMARGINGIYDWLSSLGTQGCSPVLERPECARILDSGPACLLRVWLHASNERWRVAHRPALCKSGQHGLLPQPVAHRLAVVGHRLPYCVGLGAVLALRRVG